MRCAVAPGLSSCCASGIGASMRGSGKRSAPSTVIGDTAETVVERADYPPERIKEILSKETVAVLGYGVQGRGQSLNMKDNGVNVIVGMREEGKGWNLAQQDSWTPGKTLFSLEEAA